MNIRVDSSRWGSRFQRDSAIAPGTAALLGIARQLAAAFRACGQGGAVPSATETLDECDCAHHPPAETIHPGAFVRDCRPLRGGHLQLTPDPPLPPSRAHS